MRVLKKDKARSFPDEALVGLIQHGDHGAFEKLYLRHARYIAGVAYRMLGNDADLDDIVQETFVAAFKGIMSVKDPKQIRLFLVTIAVRRANRRIAKVRRWGSVGDGSQMETASNPNAINADHLRQAHDLLRGLKKRHRVPWFLNNVEGYTIAEVSAICGRSMATVKRRIKKAEQGIQRRLLHG